MANVSSPSPGAAKPPKKALRVAGKIPPQVNRYYVKVSKIYKGFAIALLLVLFLLILQKDLQLL